MTEADLLFREYATSAAFHIALTKPMIAALSVIGEGRYTYGSREIDLAMATSKSLIRRGLVLWGSDSDEGRPTLSEAGKHVSELCKLAGMIT